ncbi:MAG: cyclic nucleotide-binding domain-containing protein [Vicinamibacteria bacterium]|nr:cyclic nucleotide-binding domain-containing protein [Vicinamibacteria bacterium]
MALSFTARSKSASVAELIAKKNFPKALELLKAELRVRKGDEKLRMQLADVLQQTGRSREAVEVLNNLADDLALSGFAGKAIAVLKRVQRIHKTPDVEEKLSYLIAQEGRKGGFDPWRQKTPEAPRQEIPEGPTEIGLEMAPINVPEPAATPEPPLFETSSDEPAAGAEPGADFQASIDDAFRDEVASLLEDIFKAEGIKPQAVEVPRPQLVETPLFRDFSREELVEVIKGLDLRTFEPGEIVMAAGEPGTSLFIVTTGRLRAYLRSAEQRYVQLRELKEGDFFGEISLLTDNPRSATVTAASYVELLEMDKKTLDEICSRQPRVREVLQEFYKQRATRTVEAAVAAARGTA